MNRSILIVICDFLLVSLLVFSTPDMTKVTDQDTPRNLKFELATNQVDSSKDLTTVMRLALEEERRNREHLLGELARTRENLSQQQTLVSERERQVQGFQQQLETKEQEAARLAQERARLQQQFESSQTNLQTLTQQLNSSSTEALLSKEKLAAMEAEAKKQLEQANALQQQLANLAQSNQVVMAEKQQLSGQLQVAMAEKRAATEQATRMQEEVKVERAEKAKLAEGVKALATKSDQLAQEVRENRPMAPNSIFFEFLTNRVQATFNAFRSGQTSGKRKETQTVLVTDGTNTYALCHIQDTPFNLANPGTDWEELTGTLNRGPVGFPIHSLIFSLQDPRVVIIPVPTNEARQFRCKSYRVSSDPYKFQDAVLVGAEEGYYGECKFQIDVTTPGYVRLDRSVLRGLFGKFNPSRGDLVFSKNGELLGIMANSAYCMMIQSFDGSAKLEFGEGGRNQHPATTLSLLSSVVTGLPFKLQ
ncbi:MAG TPA: hypothetical protein VL361_12200 [Candidatus Limnocylindrales bacterium]|nr:hypothetical protein [Candidatus Limnocylindrales bacterium]